MVDSIGRQHGMYAQLQYPATCFADFSLAHSSSLSFFSKTANDLMCYLASVSKVIKARHDNLPPAGGWCKNTTECKDDTRGKFTGLGLAGATFQSYDKNNTKHIHIVVESGNFGVYNKKNTQLKWKNIVRAGKKDDIYVINQGLHYGSNVDRMVADIHEVKDAMLYAKGNGARVLWRETSASHFDTSSGSWEGSLEEAQDVRLAECVSHTKIDKTQAWQTYNAATTPLLKSLGIDVLEVWEATFFAPEWCHIGAGVDCGHFLQPGGVTNYFTESLLKYIEDNM